MAEILNGKELAKKIRTNLKVEVEELKKQKKYPKLAVIMVGNDQASSIYVKNKSKACDEIGIDFEEYLLPEETTMQELLSLITKLNEEKEIKGILLQSPIPAHLDIQKAFETINPKKDVDGFHPISVGQACIGQDTFIPCTPLGIVRLLEEYKIPIKRKNVVILGRSNIVGKPLMQCMLKKNATVTICHSKTRNIQEITKQADILIVAIGKPKFITEEMVKENAVVIDVGMNRLENGKLCGDIDFEGVEKKASYITPVPGGVGPMTIAMLMQNVVKATKME